MSPINLLRQLFRLNNELDDYQVAAIVFEEYCRSLANAEACRKLLETIKPEIDWEK